MIKIIKLGLVAAGASLIMGASALSAQAVPPAEPNGCTGHYTVQYKQDNPDSTTGKAIGGAGATNPNGSKVGQAHSEVGRGQMVKDFHDEYCADWEKPQN